MNSSPWAKFTTSMMPKISVSPDAISARIMPVTMPFSVWITNSSIGKSAKNERIAAILHSEILLDDVVADLEIGRFGVMANGALLHDVDALARFERQRHVLLDQEDGDALAMQRIDDLVNLRDHARHQAFGRLVEQDDLGLQHHGARDGEHLLLAARQRAAGLVAPFAEHREVGEHLVEQLLLARLGDAGAVKTGAQVFHHRQQAENAAILRHLGDA